MKENAMAINAARMNGNVSNPHLVLLASSLGVLLAQIDTSVVNLALKSIAGDLRAGVSQMQWVIDAYNLVYASLLLTGGTLGDLSMVGVEFFWSELRCSRPAR